MNEESGLFARRPATGGPRALGLSLLPAAFFLGEGALECLQLLGLQCHFGLQDAQAGFGREVPACHRHHHRVVCKLGRQLHPAASPPPPFHPRPPAVWLKGNEGRRGSKKG
jgi:hypothetical protein